MSESIRLCRSFQTAPSAIPGNNTAKYLDSVARSDGFERPDWFCPDLEDSIKPELVETGRQNIIDFATTASFDGEIWPRINWDAADGATDTRDAGRSDVESLVREAGDNLTGFILPKTRSRDSVERVVEMISEVESEYGFETEQFEVCSIIETPEAATNLKEIGSYGGSTPRMIGLIFGPGDFTFGVGGRTTDGRFPEWSGITEWITTVASTNDLLCIGGTFPKVYTNEAGKRYFDGESHAEKVIAEANIGFDGSWSLHPAQTTQANTIHSPSEEMLSESIQRLRRLNDVDEAGAMLIDGEIVDTAMRRQYRQTIRTVQAIRNKSEDQARTLYDDELLEVTASEFT